MKILACAAAIVLGVTLPATGDPLTFWSDLPDDELAEALLREMTPEERVAQLFLVGWPAEGPSEELVQWIERRNIGGVKVFGWNGNNLSQLTSEISRLQRSAEGTNHSIPLFVATDQEGGWVRHIKGSTSLTAGNIALGASRRPEDSFLTGRLIGEELRRLGINMNFAPTVDVYRNPEAHVIGPRAFSSDPWQTAILATAYYRGLESQRVIATAKHFPGHGNAEGDSHGMLPVLSETFDELWERDLVPYRVLFREGMPAVLTGHLSFPSVTGDRRPASISPVLTEELLRERLDFDGLVITDDLYMGGALEYGARHGMDFADVTLAAVEAGNDIIMLSQTPSLHGSIFTTVLNAYQGRPDFRRRVDASVRRILSAKLSYLKPPDRVERYPRYPSSRETAEDNPGFVLDQASRSVTLLRNGGLPLRAEDGNILLAGNDWDFIREGRRFFPDADTLFVDQSHFYQADGEQTQRLVLRAAGYDTVVFCLSSPATLQMARRLEFLGNRVVVVSSLTPVYLRELPWVDTALAVYGWGPESFRAGFAVLAGEIGAHGSLPLGPEFVDTVP
ncbi:MAG: glycoside hydrolase family 3 protein [Spirochaetaceae bacterium]